MKLGTNCALLVIDIQQEDFQTMTVDNLSDPAWACVRNARRVLDVFRARRLPVIHVQEVHRTDRVDFGRELDGAEGLHCLEASPGTDFAWLTYPLPGEYRVVKRRYSAFFGTDLEILLRGLHVDTLVLVGGADGRVHPLYGRGRSSVGLPHPGRDGCGGGLLPGGPPGLPAGDPVSPAKCPDDRRRCGGGGVTGR